MRLLEGIVIVILIFGGSKNRLVDKKCPKDAVAFVVKTVGCS